VFQAPIGAGKSGAYQIPLLDMIDITLDHPQALIVVPSRELAEQIESELKDLAADVGVRVHCSIGGTSVGRDSKNTNAAHIVVGTLGRLIDLFDRKSSGKSNISTIIIDEVESFTSKKLGEDHNTVCLLHFQMYLNFGTYQSLFGLSFNLNRLWNCCLNSR